jgi:hypothetical protein
MYKNMGCGESPDMALRHYFIPCLILSIISIRPNLRKSQNQKPARTMPLNIGLIVGVTILNITGYSNPQKFLLTPIKMTTGIVTKNQVQ